MMMGRKTSITVRIPIDLLDRLDAYGESEFGRRFDRSLFIVEAITGRLKWYQGRSPSWVTCCSGRRWH